MKQIDLEGMPESIEEAARDLCYRLQNAQRYTRLAWEAGYALRNAIEKAHEEGLITDEQKNEAMSYDMDELIREVSEISSPDFRGNDAFWYGEELPSVVIEEEEEGEHPCGKIKGRWQKIKKKWQGTKERWQKK